MIENVWNKISEQTMIPKTMTTMQQKNHSKIILKKSLKEIQKQGRWKNNKK